MVSQVKTSPSKAKTRPSRRRKKLTTAASQPAKGKTASLAASVIVEAGSRSRSSLRQLEKNTGPLIHEIGQIVHAIHAVVPEPGSIVIVYREKRSSRSRSASPFGFFFRAAELWFRRPPVRVSPRAALTKGIRSLRTLSIPEIPLI
jgi:hypothetical protein